jgi:hypothetical protein
MYGLSCGALPFRDMLGEHALHNGDSLLRLNGYGGVGASSSPAKKVETSKLERGGNEIRGVWLPLTRNTELRA